MLNIDQRLAELQEQMSRKKKLSAQIEALRKQVHQMESKVIETEWDVKHETDDVSELLNNPWKCLWYRLTGYFDTAYTREENEMLDARLRHDLAKEELEETKAQLERLRDEYIPYQRCDQEYEKLMKQKVEAIRASGEPAGEELLQLEKDLQQTTHQLNELNEALSACNRASHIAIKIKKHLDAAKDYATLDIVSSSYIADGLKYAEMDDAQALVKNLSNALQTLKTELADVHLDTRFPIDPTNSLRVADIFLDGVYFDLLVRDRIIQSLERIEKTIEKIQALHGHLQSLLIPEQECQQRLQRQIDTLIANTPA